MICKKCGLDAICTAPHNGSYYCFKCYPREEMIVETKDAVNPSHYKQHPSGVECIDVVEWFTPNIANVVKYCWRAGLKPGNDVIQDLEKAKWYIEREIKRLSKGSK